MAKFSDRLMRWQASIMGIVTCTLGPTLTLWLLAYLVNRAAR